MTQPTTVTAPQTVRAPYPILTVPTLTSDANYDAWLAGVHDALRKEGLEHLLLGSDALRFPHGGLDRLSPTQLAQLSFLTGPDSVNPVEADRRAKHILLSTTSSAIHAAVLKLAGFNTDEATPLGLLRHVQTALSESKSTGRTALDWTGRWANLRRADFATWPEYTAQFEHAFRMLAAVGTPLPELFAVRTLLAEIAKTKPAFTETLRPLYDRRDGASLKRLINAINSIGD